MVVSPRLDQLPPELYSAILNQVHPLDLQYTSLALIRALARRPISHYHLFEYVRLKDADKVFLLYKHLRKHRDDVAIIRGFSLESWTVDADIAVNLIALLTHVRELRVCIGPNFAPEHLEEMFDKPRDMVRLISLRFRPYVQRATYYQFLKGAYFDSTLLALSRWPSSSLPSLSIIQDPLDPSIAPTGKFAQPLVFFRLDPFKTLAISPFASTIKHFRLRIPSRQVARFIYSCPRSLPLLELLDLSTCNLTETDVEQLLGQFGKLKALVLDDCPIVSYRGDLSDGAEDRWAALGKIMALAGVKRTKEREKKLKAWLEVNNAVVPGGQQQQAAPIRAIERRPKKGRKGLATAKISLRDSSTPLRVPAPQAPVPGSSQPRIRILPPEPSLRLFSVTAPSSITKEKYDGILTDFERGWAEGIAQLAAIRGRLMTSWANGMRVMCFAEDFDEEVKGDGEMGLEGLEDMERGEEFTIQNGECPLLCLAGSGKMHVEGHGHTEQCGHSVGWDIWGDEL